MPAERYHQPRSPSEIVALTVAAREGVEPTELRPLYDVVDPEALDALFATTGRAGRTDGEVVFSYHGFEVTVDSSGRVELGGKGRGTGEGGNSPGGPRQLSTPPNGFGDVVSPMPDASGIMGEVSHEHDEVDPVTERTHDNSWSANLEKPRHAEDPGLVVEGAIEAVEHTAPGNHVNLVTHGTHGHPSGYLFEALEEAFGDDVEWEYVEQCGCGGHVTRVHV